MEKKADFIQKKSFYPHTDIQIFRFFTKEKLIHKFPAEKFCSYFGNICKGNDIS